MLKIGLGLSLALAAILGTAAHLMADRHPVGVQKTGGHNSLPAESPARLVAAVSYLGRSPVARDFVNPSANRTVFTPVPQHRKVIWHPNPAGPNPFGFIPTEWETRPQLLPNTWDVQIVFASDDGRQ